MDITRDIFEQQCKRRFGISNPERMRLAYWEWMVRRGGGPYGVRMELGLEPNYLSCTPDGCSAGGDPDWCFDRFGMSRTLMPDGRIICIAGEHEDFYDPDFCIYNDLIVLKPGSGETGVTLESGEVEIYGYPDSVFPPTDFHSATLAGDRIVVIGRLGYAETRIDGTTPVVMVDPATYRIDRAAPLGPSPGWVYRHHASYDSARHAVVVRGGKIHVEGARKETPHLAAHRLYLTDWRWEIISRQETHRRFLIEKIDGDHAAFREPKASSFRPEHVPHLQLTPEDRGVPVYGIDIQGVRVTFMEFHSQVRVLIEGDLPLDATDQLLMDVLENLHNDTAAPWALREVQSFNDD